MAASERVLRIRKAFVDAANQRGFNVYPDEMTRDVVMRRKVRSAGAGELVWERRIPWDVWVGVEDGVTEPGSLVADVAAEYEGADL